jgi:acetyl esterase/lipase
MPFTIKSLITLTFLTTALFASHAFALPDGVKLAEDIAYGSADKQQLDIYYPSVKQRDAPVIFMVHGGAWRIGDKASKAVVKNKVNHWVPKGFIFISVNYRMLPNTDPVTQAEDIEKALVFTQKNIHQWGGASVKVILMGHSAGAHLVSLVSARHDKAIQPWLGTIALDSAAYDIEKIMSSSSPPRLYKKAFGKDADYWKKASPLHALDQKLPPFLAVCSSKRKDSSCSQAHTFIEKAKQHGTLAKIMPVNYSHRKINVELGSDDCYTRSVDEFITELHPTFEEMLGGQGIQKCTAPVLMDAL